MIRGVSIVSLVTLLILVLYVPSTHPPTRFLEQLRNEHEAAVVFWGPDPAYRMLDRAMRMQSGAATASPIPATTDMPRSAGINGAVASEMASVNHRLFNNAYFRSVDALLMLASYRLSALLEWLPWLLPLAVVAAVDGGLVRIIRAKEFLQHDPEMFAIWCSLLIVSICTTIIAFVIPRQLHPATMATSPVVISVLLGRAVASFHRRA
ncbi:DUF4400 domain-containing protein [Burkholderia vietnamiensis]|uniref:DUF4400 domain-containing protein n=1 Tax=Burkholderia vietnamiensis TaxID=60552 RepID=UPI001D13E874|nr:DUF4400 domain-containing protein [Burkholderia vietnamiensis]UEC01763.1 DUF4400 domain-containing protein [Burkholderia vietnamiensis]